MDNEHLGHLRLPRGLLSALKAYAAGQGMSLNTYIVTLLVEDVRQLGTVIEYERPVWTPKKSANGSK